jgi:Transposase DDE domain
MPSYQSPAVGATFRHFLHGFLHSGDLPFRDVLTASQLEQAAAADHVAFGTGPDDVYSVAVTLWAFVAQVLSDQKSCVAAVARVLVFLHILGRPPCGAGTGAYCKARAKLPERFLQRLSCNVGRQLEAEADDAWRWHGHRVVLVDGSTLSMPDTLANQAVYPQQRSQKPGVGFPILRWVALVGLATAATLGSAFGPWRGKETGETALFRELLAYLQPGDVLLADRYYCTYWIVAAALARGVHVVFRKHQRRHTDFRTGRRLGANDHRVTWTKPARPEWMAQDEYEAMPATLTMREVRTQIAKPGCRVKELVVVTTLLDAAAYPLDDITDLYNERWQVEIDLRSLKTQMKMDILRCQTPEMVRKEIWAHLLAYNLVRTVMAQAARAHDLTPRQLSFAGAMQTLNEFRTVLLGADATELPGVCSTILEAIASHRIGNRPDRCEPRKVKRRPKGYGRMVEPRAQERAACLNG